MKKFFPLIAVTSITLFSMTLFSMTLFSSMAFAGGANCDSMKGHGKQDMSAEAWQEFKQNHAWIFSEDPKTVEKSTVPGAESDNATPAKTSADLVEI